MIRSKFWHAGLIATSLFFLVALFGCGGSSGGTSSKPTPTPVPVPKSLTVLPASPTIAKSTSTQLIAIAVLSNGATANLTSSATWSSSASHIAAVSDAPGSKGHVTGNSEGAANISARVSGVSSSAGITVTPATLDSITILPANSSIANGTTLQLSAIGNFSDGTTQDLTAFAGWSSSNPMAALVSNAPDSIGQVTAISPGATTISARYLGVSGSTSVTVTPATLSSLTVTPPESSLAKGTQQQLTAIGTFSDNTTQDLTTGAIWRSSARGIASVGNAPGRHGLVTGRDVGNASVSASFGSSSGSSSVAVTAPTLSSIAITPPDPSLPKGTNIQLTATGTFSDGSTQDLTTSVSWTSSVPGNAVVSGAQGSEGQVTALAVGSTTITAAQGSVSGTTSVTVTAPTLSSITISPPGPSLAKGTSSQLTATGNYSDGSTHDLTPTASWTSSAPQKVSVGSSGTSNGTVTGLAVGNAVITATQKGISGSTTVTVTPAVLVSISINPAEPSLAKGTTQQLTATGVYSDNSTQDLTQVVSWNTVEPRIAIISNVPGEQGLLFGRGVGGSIVRAFMGSVLGSVTATVTAPALSSIVITPPSTSIANGTSQQLVATGTFSDKSTQDLTLSVSWTSSDPTKAAVSNAQGSPGLVTATGVGSVTITATQDGVSGTAAVTVTAATLTSIAITPPNASVAKGTSQQLIATGTFSDQTTQDLTRFVSWTSSDSTIAVVSNAAGSRGLATGTGVGSATITARRAGVSGSASVSVTAAVLTSITITPPSLSLAKGTTQQLIATGVFSDSTTQDLTTSVSWISSASAVAVSNAAGSQGQVTGVAIGNATIAATQGGITGTAAVTVTAATLASINITPPSASIANGTSVQLTATGIFSDASTQDLTQSVSWTSSDQTKVVVSNAPGSQGSATATGVGSATITATQAGVSGTAAVTVTAATLTSITITPPGVSLAKGTSQQLTATGTFTDQSTQDLTRLVSWTSSDSTIAAVSNAPGSRGLVTGTGAGSAAITAGLAGITGSASVMVTAAVLTSITITPPTLSLAKGTTQQLRATGRFSDNTTQDLTATADWTSSDLTTAAVSNAQGSAGQVTGVAAGNATITAKQNGIVGTAAVTVTGATLASINVTPVSSSIGNGTSVQLTATGTFTDKSTQDLTQSVSWTSSDQTKAVVSNAPGSEGLVTGTGAGSVTITAAQDGVSGTAAVTVTAAKLTSITITPPSTSLAKGTSQQLTATGSFTDQSTQDLTGIVSWTSSDSTIAAVSNASGDKGLVTGTGAGSTTITARLAGVSGSASVTVTGAVLTSITITPPSLSIARGTTQQLTATGIFSDSTTQDLTTSVSWVSSASAVAVSNAQGSAGQVTGVAVGSATITATEGGVAGTATVTVTAATLTSINITPPSVSIAKGTTVQLVATGVYSDNTTQNLTAAVSWSSSDQTKAVVSNAPGSEGVVTGTGVGSATITATQDGVAAMAVVTVTGATLTSITITPPSTSLAKGTSQQLTATGTFTDQSTQDLTRLVLWTSSDSTIAEVSNVPGSRGLVTGTRAGSTTITAVLSGVSGSASVTVTAATLTSITIIPPGISLAKGTSQQLTATGTFTDQSTQDLTRFVLWTSSDSTIAAVSNVPGSKGLVTGTGTGSATITAGLAGVSGGASVSVTAAVLTSITITPPSLSLAKGTTQQLTATGTFSDSTTQDLTASVSWISSASAVAVSNAEGSQGQVTGVAVGNATIAATQAGITGTAAVTVTAATLTSISITPPSASIANGTTVQLTATGTFSDQSTQDLTQAVSWTSSDQTKAVVSNAPGSQGLATATGVGSATITATEDGVSGTAAVTVTAAKLMSITITPPQISLAKGTSQQLTATGIFTDQSTQDLTRFVSWTSSDSTIATVSNASGSRGLVTGAGVGSATITATRSGVSGSASVSVTAAVLTSITITPPSLSLAKGTTQQLTATGTFSDNTTQDLTTSVSWVSSASAVAVSNAEGSQGQVTGVAVGNATVAAAQGGITGTAAVQVTAATLTSINITPPSVSIAKGTTAQLVATGVYSDNTTQDLTAAVSWSSSDQTKAFVSNAPGSEGVVTGAGVGSATITATQDGVAAMAVVTVTGATLTSITITPPSTSLAKGTSQQLTATGTFTDQSTQDLTRFVLWTSSDSTIAAVSNVPGSKGLVTGTGAGSTTITAALAGVSGGASLTVTAAVLTSITVTPPSPSLAKGTTQQLTATGTFSDGTTQDLTTSVSWISSASAVAVSNAEGSQGQVTGVAVGNATIAATQSGITGTAAVTVTAATLTSINITPPSASIANGTTAQLVATGVYSDNTTQDLTQSVSWTSSDETKAVVSNAQGRRGLVTGTGVGSATITAAQGGVSGTAAMTVTAATVSSITITPPDTSIAKGTTVRLNATCNLSDGTTQDCTTQVSWTSADSTIAQVSNDSGTQGLVSGIGKGSTSITATVPGIQGSTTVTVTAETLTSITVMPANPSVVAGFVIFMTATGNFSDGTTQDLTKVTSWTSSDLSVAQIFSNNPSFNGLLLTFMAGTTTVTATFNGIQGSTTVTVTAPVTLSSITITPPDSSIAKGTTIPLNATCNLSDGTTQDCTTQVSWTSADNTIAQVSNAQGTQGLVTGIGVGNTSITATLNGIQGSTTVTVTAATVSSITITPPDSSIAKGTTVRLNATCNLSDGTTQDCTTQVSWTSGDITIAQVSNGQFTEGWVKAIGVGKTSIIATLNGIQGSTTVTVTAATLSSITVTPPDTSIAKGTTVQLNATCNLSDGTTQDCTAQMSWTSSAPGTASVSNTPGSEGLVAGTATGTATITATQNGVSGTATVTVTVAALTSITISPPDVSLPKGTTQQLTATGNFTDGTTQDLTISASWVSSAPDTASISNSQGSQGLLTGVATGTASISATQSGITGITSATVTAATLNAIEIVPPDSSVAAGTSLQLSAVGLFSDGSTRPLTKIVTWGSAPAGIVTISNAAGSHGLLTGIAQGTATISAAKKGITGTTSIKITAATLKSIAITPASPSIAAGVELQLVATGTFSDGSTQDLTTSVSWSSSSNAVAVVSNTAGSEGLLTAVAAGTATIMAAQAGISGTTVATVTTATLTSIAVTPLNPSIPQGTTLQLVATGSYSDGTMKEITSSVSWTSASPTVASVSNAPGQVGLVTALNPGTAAITAQGPGAVKGSTTATVTAVSALSGQVLSGPLPIAGADVTLYEVSSSYGGTPSAISSATSDGNGRLGFSPFTCAPTNAQLYAVAVGGDAGVSDFSDGLDSPIVMMTALGACDALPTSIVINEVTTVASTYALAQFFNKTVTQHVPAVGAPASNATGLANAVALATTNLANVTSGAAAAFLSTGSNTPTNLNSLANILAACVDSNSQSSQACSQLFAATTISGFTTPVDTMQAILNEALRPANSVSALFNIQAMSGSPLPYTPALSSAPPDWALALNYTGGGLNAPQRIAFDGTSNAWIANKTGNSVTKLSPLGVALSPSSGFQGGGISGPLGIAVDGSGNVWVPGLSSNKLTELNSLGAVVFTSAAVAGGLQQPSAVAIDQQGNVWVPNSAGSGQGANSISKFTSAGVALSPINGFTGGGINLPNDVAIDAGGNAWIANHFGGSATITKMQPSGSPASGSPGGGAGLSNCFSIQIDKSGNAWIGNQADTRLAEFTNNLTAISPFTGITIGAQSGTTVTGLAIDGAGNIWAANNSGPSANGISEINSGATIAFTGTNGLRELTGAPVSMAIDRSGDMWVSNSSAPVLNSVTEYVGVATPVKTPLIGPPALP